MDPENDIERDDLYEELASDLNWYGLAGVDLDQVMEKVEEHADRRTARALRIISDHIRRTRIGPAGLTGHMTGLEAATFLDQAADRIDPDVTAD